MACAGGGAGEGGFCGLQLQEINVNKCRTLRKIMFEKNELGGSLWEAGERKGQAPAAGSASTAGCCGDWFFLKRE